MSPRRRLALGAANVVAPLAAFIRPRRASIPREGPPSHSHPRLPYLPGIDGLRAIGVLAVLLYHADVHWIPGGFLGVELFFVVSGYLITSILLAERSEGGSTDLRGFWLRRARRLLPAAFAVVIASLVYTVLFLPEEVAALRGDALSAFAYVSNWYLIFGDESYFEFASRPSLLRHLWSLAVEEQFYIVWPLVLSFVLMRMRRRFALTFVLALAFASAALMAYLHEPGTDPSRVYYGTDTRIAGLLIGSALAFVVVPGALAGAVRTRLARTAVNVAGIASLAGVAYFFLAVGEFDAELYRGGFALMAIVTAVLIASAVQPSSLLTRYLLGSMPLRWIGTRSYSIYLWHWPVFMLTRPGLDVQIDGIELLAVRFAITFALAELSYQLIETPFRRGTIWRLLDAWRESAMRSLPQLAMRYAAPIGVLAGVSFTLGFSVAAAQSPAPPSYLAQEQVSVLSWSAETTTPPAQTPAVVSTPVPTASPHPFRPDASLVRLQTPAPVTATPVPASEGTPTPIHPLPPPDPTAPPPPPSPTDPPSPPPPVVTSGFAGRVFALGDSVMLGAVPNLQSTFAQLEIDASVGRQAPEALAILQQRRDAGVLGDAVVIHIGNNGIFSAAHFDQMMHILADVPQVVFVNVKVPRNWEAPVNSMLAERIGNYANARLVDWHTVGSENPGYFAGDGIHVGVSGATAYSSLIASALP